MRYINYHQVNQRIAACLEQYLLQRVLKDSLKKDPYHTPHDKSMVDWKLSVNLSAYRDNALAVLGELGYSGEQFIDKRPTNNQYRQLINGDKPANQASKLSIDTCLWILSTVGSAPLHNDLPPSYNSTMVAAVSYVYHVMKR